MSERLLTQPRIICLHISQLLLPLPSRLALRHEVEKSTSLLLPATTLPSILLLTATAGAAVFWRKKYPFACFWMLWFFINLLIESSFLPLELIYEHRMYLPSAGLIATLVFLSFQYAPAHLGANESVAISKRLKVILGSLILCGVALTFARNKDWKDEVTLWADNARKYPESVRSWNNLGSAYIQTGQGEAAEASFRRAFEVDPTYPPARANLALICLNQGRVDEAVALIANFEETKIGTFSAEVYYDFGVVFEKKGILDKAIFHYRQAINRLPAHTEACFNLAIVYRRAGKYAEAREWFREFLRLWDGPVDSPYVAEAQRSLKELEKY